MSKPTGIAAGLGGIWVVEHRGDSLVRIDPKTNEIVADPLGDRGPNELCGMGVEDVIVSDGSVWTSNNEARSVSRIDATRTSWSPRSICHSGSGQSRRWRRDLGQPGQETPDGGFGEMSVARIDPATNQPSSFALDR